MEYEYRWHIEYARGKFQIQKKGKSKKTLTIHLFFNFIFIIFTIDFATLNGKVWHFVKPQTIKIYGKCIVFSL